MKTTDESVYRWDTPRHKKTFFFSNGVIFTIIEAMWLFEGPSVGPKPALSIGFSNPTVNGSYQWASVSPDYNEVKTKFMFKDKFLVASTRLYIPLCQSVGLSVGLLVRPSVTLYFFMI